jgi:hypothetical protein
MAGQGKKTFVAGEVLTAQDVNDYLMDQSVMNFATTAARSSAIPTPTDGMVTYRQDIDSVEAYNGTAWFPVNRSVVSYERNTGATLTLTTSTETELFRSSAFTPSAGRLYEITVDIGFVQKITGGGNIEIKSRLGSSSGTLLAQTLYSAQTVNSVWSHHKVFLATSTQLGTSSTVIVATAQTNTNGAVVANTDPYIGAIIVKDIGKS